MSSLTTVEVMVNDSQTQVLTRERVRELGIMIQKLPRTKTQAIVLFPGELGAGTRRALDIWQQPGTGALVLLTGNNHKVQGLQRPGLELLRNSPYSVSHHFLDNFHIQDRAESLLDQATWATGLIKKLKITSILVVASPHQMAQVYMTLLKCFQKQDTQISMFPAPVSISTIGPDDSWYDDTNVCTYDELKSYLVRLQPKS